MNFMQAVTSCFKGYFNFRDRGSRSEYWYFMLFCLLLGFVVGVILGLMKAGVFGFALSDSTVNLVNILFNLVIIIPSVSVTARRLHDVNRSGWWQLIVLTVIGLIPLLYWMFKRGDSEENRFGADPLSYYNG